MKLPGCRKNRQVFRQPIAVVKNMFRLPGVLSGNNVASSVLDGAAKMVGFHRTTNILIVDNATWHRRKSTNWHRWQPKCLPPYSPDLNPIERIWLTMKSRWFNNDVCKNEQHLIERLDQAILDLTSNPKKT
ncbi:MAG: transposase [Desulfobacterales bacterium]|nr:transposase [Desulfobacterales bacterium]